MVGCAHGCTVFGPPFATYLDTPRHALSALGGSEHKGVPSGGRFLVSEIWVKRGVKIPRNFRQQHHDVHDANSKGLGGALGLKLADH